MVRSAAILHPIFHVKEAFMAARVRRCAPTALVLAIFLVSCSKQSAPGHAQPSPAADAPLGATAAAAAVADQEICPGQPIPAGWVIVSTRPCAGCCGSSGIVQMQTIRNIDQMPPNSTVEICPGQPIPAGWVIVSTRPCAGCCGNSGIAQMPTIKKL